MVDSRRWVLGGLSSLTLGWVLLMNLASVSAAEGPRSQAPVWVGNGSCAATSCHGGARERVGLKGAEYSFSEAYDPHPKAYSVLFDDRSKQIEKRYRRLADLESARPWDDDACLRCHVHQGYDSNASRSRTDRFTVADGAGCESCHGPASKWLAPHVEAGWKGLSDRQKFEGFGLRPSKDLLVRGKICAECHVGIGSTDVNHDLIAAGHPRLNFEYGNQLAKLPKHWRIEADLARNPDHEARVWVLGQILGAKAALDLLESRATRSIPENSTAPWPEFAEYSCFSCHHSLVKNGWPSANTTLTARAGQFQWGTWYSPMTRVLRPVVPGPDPGSGEPIEDLLKEMMERPSPEPSVVARQARAASANLARLADRINGGLLPVAKVRAMLSEAVNSDADEQPLDWDRAARQYLAIIALDRTIGQLDPNRSARPSRSGLEALRHDLELPRRLEGRPGLSDSPGPWKLEKIQADFDSLIENSPQAGRIGPR